MDVANESSQNENQENESQCESEAGCMSVSAAECESEEAGGEAESEEAGETEAEAKSESVAEAESKSEAEAEEKALPKGRDVQFDSPGYFRENGVMVSVDPPEAQKAMEELSHKEFKMRDLLRAAYKRGRNDATREMIAKYSKTAIFDDPDDEAVSLFHFREKIW